MEYHVVLLILGLVVPGCISAVAIDADTINESNGILENEIPVVEQTAANGDGCYWGSYALSIDACFEATVNQMNYIDASASCISRGRGDLPIIHNEKMNDFVTSKMNAFDLSSIWLGLRWINGEWTWNDGSAMTFHAFEEGYEHEEGNDCVSIQEYLREGSDIIHSKWVATTCVETHSFFCLFGADTMAIQSDAERDPHFMVKVQGTEDRVCFDYDAEKDAVIQLLYDPINNVAVNGKLFEAKQYTADHPKTYFQDIAVITREASIIASRETIKINGITFDWEQVINMTMADNVLVQSIGDNSVYVAIDKSIAFLLVRATGNTDLGHYMGFYITRDWGLSARAHGIIGQFKNTLVDIKGDVTDKDAIGTIRFPHSGREELEVHSNARFNLIAKGRLPCWQVKNNGEGLLYGEADDYLVPSLTYFDMSDSLKELLADQVSF